MDWEGKSRCGDFDHPTVKPTRLFEIPMEQHTRQREVVLEPFSGSGSQIIAAEKLARRCRALEIQPAFVDVAVQRWQKASGKAATLEDGLSYARRSPPNEVSHAPSDGESVVPGRARLLRGLRVAAALAKEIAAATARLRSSYARRGSTTADTRAHIVAKAEQGRTAARESP